ncbi:heavy metal translocating P-type ATPase [Gimesia algae]|uniref:Copper-transporting P-type ATPase n=1 Tax=Gimesia algae TaxID=2527971 RepID=A0A517VEU9_9PLAN|nr:heavy metal translocating P-type ATPase [Gimesia algae]QDT91534.1 Copper-transporting P-type ATPase [Gimesia algae]
MSCCHSTREPPLERPQALLSADAEKKQFMWCVVRLVSAAFIAGNSMLFTLTFNLSIMEPATRQWFLIGLLLSVVLVFSLLVPQFIAGLKSAWQRRRLGVEGLFLLGMAGAIGISLNSVLTGSGSVYFEVVNILLVIYSFGALVKETTQYRVALATQSPLDRLSSCLVETESGECLRVPITQVQPKNRIRLAAGDIVPIDGIIVQGEAFVSESGMTGEPYVQPKIKGDFLYATSLVVDAPLVVEASRAGNVREIDAIQRVIEKLKQTPSRWQSLAERIASWFTPFVCSVALTTFVVWMTLDSVSAGLFTALAVLLVACPCAFGFATPIAIWQANSKMFELAIAPQRGDLVERLAEIDTVAFDKTGTLTVVQPTLSYVDVRMDCEWSREEILEIAAAVESRSCHPIAAAFHRDGTNQFTCESFMLVPAVGVQAVVRRDETQHDVFLGRVQNESDEDNGKYSSWFRNLAAADETVVFVLMMQVDGEITARFQVTETAFDSVPSGMVVLKETGVQTFVLSGDSSSRVHKLPADTTVGAMTPEDKADYVRKLNRDGAHVLFVGDGINDALAMAESDIAVAVSNGSTMLHETADAVWYGNDLRVFAQLIDMSRRTTNRLRTTLRFALVYNTIGMIVAASGYLHPVFAAVLMLGSSLFVVIRSVDPGSPAPVRIPRDRDSLLQSSQSAPAPETLVQISLNPCYSQSQPAKTGE